MQAESDLSAILVLADPLLQVEMVIMYNNNLEIFLCEGLYFTLRKKVCLFIIKNQT